MRMVWHAASKYLICQSYCQTHLMNQLSLAYHYSCEELKLNEMVVEEIESVLNSELENIFRYLIKNDLIVNLHKGKAWRRPNMLHGKLALKFGPFKINSTNNYEHLGSVIDEKSYFKWKFQRQLQEIIFKTPSA